MIIFFYDMLKSVFMFRCWARYTKEETVDRRLLKFVRSDDDACRFISVTVEIQFCCLSMTPFPVFSCGRVCGCVCVCHSQLVDCIPLLSLSLGIPVPPLFLPFYIRYYPYYYNHILLRKNIR